jgi:hypothetical protein
MLNRQLDDLLLPLALDDLVDERVLVIVAVLPEAWPPEHSIVSARDTKAFSSLN